MAVSHVLQFKTGNGFVLPRTFYGEGIPTPLNVFGGEPYAFDTDPVDGTMTAPLNAFGGEPYAFDTDPVDGTMTAPLSILGGEPYAFDTDPVGGTMTAPLNISDS